MAVTETIAPPAPETEAPVAAAPKAKATKAETKSFTVDRDTLVAATSMAARAAANRTGSLAAIRNLRLVVANSRMTLTGTDLDVTITTTMKVTGRQSASASVPAQLLVSIAKACEDDDVDLVFETSAADLATPVTNLTVHSGAYLARLIGQPVDEFPTMVDAAGDAVEIDASELVEAIDHVAPAAASDPQRPILTGVLLNVAGGKMAMVATDSYRLSHLKTTIDALDRPVLVPSASLNEVERMVATHGADAVVKVAVDERSITFDVNGDRLTSRLIEGDYPAFAKLMPAKTDITARVKIDRDALARAVNQCSPLASGPIGLEIRSSGVTVTAIATDVGNATCKVPAELDGDPITVAFNAAYLLAALKAFDGEHITLGVTDNLKPVLMTGEKPASRQFHLLMPVRVS